MGNQPTNPRQQPGQPQQRPGQHTPGTPGQQQRPTTPGQQWPNKDNNRTDK